MDIGAHAVVYGDDISTDLIIAGKYTKTMNLQELADHAMEDLDPGFLGRSKDGAIVAGENFGCGSSREQAPLALMTAGIRFVVAKSFARIFFRNAINLGLPAFVCDTSGINDADALRLDMDNALLYNDTTGERITLKPMPPVMHRIIEAGGVVKLFQERGGFEMRTKEV